MMAISSQKFMICSSATRKKTTYFRGIFKHRYQINHALIHALLSSPIPRLEAFLLWPKSGRRRSVSNLWHQREKTLLLREEPGWWIENIFRVCIYIQYICTHLFKSNYNELPGYLIV